MNLLGNIFSLCWNLQDNEYLGKTNTIIIILNSLTQRMIWAASSKQVVCGDFTEVIKNK